MTAFEIAKKLEAEGEEIAFLGGIDGPADLRKIRVLENFRDILTEFLPQMGVISQEQMDEFNSEHGENVRFAVLNSSNANTDSNTDSVRGSLPCTGSQVRRGRVDPI